MPWNPPRYCEKCGTRKTHGVYCSYCLPMPGVVRRNKALPEQFDLLRFYLHKRPHLPT